MDLLIVFAKAPRPGQVKSRLAAALGEEEACRAYEGLLRQTARSLSGISHGMVCYSPADSREELRGFFPEHWEFAAQSGGDLGERMFEALSGACRRGMCPVLIGTDCPYLTRADIEAGWRALDTRELVIGPAEDGGYWLIGARQPSRTLFEGVSWGSEKVMQETLARCAALQVEPALLRRLPDVDTLRDWEDFLRWKKQAEAMVAG